jgi:hypothetical protein
MELTVELDRQHSRTEWHRPQERGGGPAGARPELDHQSRLFDAPRANEPLLEEP